jgi:nitroimidazol reductase NimA-like FMN-containing flavoprotein (pyridoxamine 5'-phosphate oxidase superfamily)
MTTDAPVLGMQRLDHEECLRLLAIEDVGRIALIQGSAPAIFPVNYVLDGSSPVFRTDPGTKLSHGPGTTVCFEIDGFDRDERSGWSVVVTGVLEPLDETDAETRARVRTLPVVPWGGGEKAHWMRVVPGLVTGRRVGPGLGMDDEGWSL